MIVHFVDHFLVDLSFVSAFLLRSAVGAVVIGFVALMEVCLAFDLSLLYSGDGRDDGVADPR